MPIDLSWTCDSGAQLSRWQITESRDQLAQMYNQIWGDAFDIQTYEEGSKHKLSSRNLIATQFPNHALQFSEHGKPLLSPATAHINHSHAGDYSVFIHHQSQSVGVDIEQIRPQLHRIYKRFCNDYELNWLGKNPSLDALLLIWCAKEALYKAIGQKGTDFRIHLQIEPIATHPETSIANSAESMFNSVSEINNHTINIAQFDTNGIIQAEIKLPGFEQKIQLPYLRWDDYACVWAVL